MEEFVLKDGSEDCPSNKDSCSADTNRTLSNQDGSKYSQLSRHDGDDITDRQSSSGSASVSTHEEAEDDATLDQGIPQAGCGSGVSSGDSGHQQRSPAAGCSDRGQTDDVSAVASESTELNQAVDYSIHRIKPQSVPEHDTCATGDTGPETRSGCISHTAAISPAQIRSSSSSPSRDASTLKLDNQANVARTPQDGAPSQSEAEAAVNLTTTEQESCQARSQREHANHSTEYTQSENFTEHSILKGILEGSVIRSADKDSQKSPAGCPQRVGEETVIHRTADITAVDSQWMSQLGHAEAGPRFLDPGSARVTGDVIGGRICLDHGRVPRYWVSPDGRVVSGVQAPSTTRFSDPVKVENVEENGRSPCVAAVFTTELKSPRTSVQFTGDTVCMIDTNAASSDTHTLKLLPQDLTVTSKPNSGKSFRVPDLSRSPNPDSHKGSNPETKSRMVPGQPPNKLLQTLGGCFDSLLHSVITRAIQDDSDQIHCPQIFATPARGKEVEVQTPPASVALSLPPGTSLPPSAAHCPEFTLEALQRHQAAVLREISPSTAQSLALQQLDRQNVPVIAHVTLSR